MRVDEVEERPELLQRVLDGSSRQEEAVFGRDLLQLLHQAAAGIFDALPLVDDEVLPVVRLQGAAVDDANLLEEEK